jgi:hypothetical protein
VEDQQGSIALWEETRAAILQSQGKFPQKHIHFACVHAHNLGAKAFYYGRSQEAERWISMAWNLSNLQDLNDAHAFEKIKEVRAIPTFLSLHFRAGFADRSACSARSRLSCSHHLHIARPFAAQTFRGKRGG